MDYFAKFDYALLLAIIVLRIASYKVTTFEQHMSGSSLN